MILPLLHRALAANDHEVPEADRGGGRLPPRRPPPPTDREQVVRMLRRAEIPYWEPALLYPPIAEVHIPTESGLVVTMVFNGAGALVTVDLVAEEE